MRLGDWGPAHRPRNASDRFFAPLLPAREKPLVWRRRNCGYPGPLNSCNPPLTDATACFDGSTCVCACASSGLGGISFQAVCWGAGTMVGWLVSRTIRSGHRYAECSRMIDLSTCGSLKETAPTFVGRCQSVRNSSARRALPTKPK
jgi:hypothetical protein